jgi:hypothetical protein
MLRVVLVLLALRLVVMAVVFRRAPDDRQDGVMIDLPMLEPWWEE